MMWTAIFQAVALLVQAWVSNVSQKANREVQAFDGSPPPMYIRRVFYDRLYEFIRSKKSSIR